MRYTKSDVVLSLAAGLFEQEDIALIDKAERLTGIDFDTIEEDTLQLLADGDEETLAEFWKDPALHQQIATGAVKAAGAVGQHVANAASHVGQLAAAHPAIAGGTALALGAAAALRARSNAKKRAQARGVMQGAGLR